MVWRWEFGVTLLDFLRSSCLVTLEGGEGSSDNCDGGGPVGDELVRRKGATE